MQGLSLLLPAVGASGVGGAAWLLARMMVARRLRPRVRQVTERLSEVRPEINTVHDTETEFLLVPTINARAEALEEAIRRETKFNPAVAATLQRVLHVADQISSGQQAAARTKFKPGAWKEN